MFFSFPLLSLPLLPGLMTVYSRLSGTLPICRTTGLNDSVFSRLEEYLINLFIAQDIALKEVIALEHLLR